LPALSLKSVAGVNGMSKPPLDGAEPLLAKSC
jgi:hypothetical protein